MHKVHRNDCLQALLHSYSCLDFASILDVSQLRVHKLRKLMKDRVQNRQALCAHCAKNFTWSNAEMGWILHPLWSHQR